VNAPAPAPYAGLTPDRVLDAVAAAGFEPDGRLLALPSYENRVYQVGIEDGSPLVAKFYRPQRWTDVAIAEEHAFAHELAEGELPVVAPLRIGGESLLRHEGFRYTLFPRRGGRAPELESSEHLAWIGRLMARLHAVGSRQVFRQRGTIDAETFVRASARTVAGSPLLPPQHHSRYLALAAELADRVEQAFAAVGPRLLRLHGDCHAGNVLWTDAGPHFVDLDDSRMGPAVQDLWMLAPSAEALDALLEGYAEFRDFDWNERRLIEPLRVMRQMHWAGWVVARWHDPAFPQAFPQVGEARWWDQHLADLAEARERLDAAFP